MGTKLLFILIASGTLFLNVNQLGVLGATDCIMTPESDLFLFVGDDLELNCTIRQSNSSEDTQINQSYVSLLNIKLNNERPPGASLTYDIERKTLRMYNKNITYGDAGFYICYYNDTFKNLRKVNIGELPRKPDNLFCISKNFEDMTCYVDVYTNSSLPTNWTMMFRTNSNSPWQELPSTNCSDNKQSKHSCQWNPVTKQGSVSGFTFERMIDYYEVRVTSTNRLGNSTSDVIKFKPEDIVKPAAFTSLVTTMTSVSSRVELSWRCPRYSSICNRVPLEFMVTVICQEDWNIPDIHLPVTMDMNYTVTDLIPHAKYTFRVQGKPNATDGDIYWSDPIDDNITTHSDVPGRSTTVNTGSFIALDCSTTELCIVLYWKNPEPKYRHGEIKNYSIEIQQDRVNEETKEALVNSKVSPATTDNASNALTELKSTETISGLRVYARLITKVQKTMSYTGKMWVSSDKGNSTAFSQFAIPNWSQGLQVRVNWVAVEMSEDGVLVSWDMASAHCHNVTEVTYYWCSTNQDIHGNSSYIMCQDDFDWAIRYVQNGCGNVTFDWLNKTEDKFSYKFAVSIATGNISGGMEWETLRFNGYQSVPDEPLYSASVEKSSLIISMLHGEYYIGEGGRPHMYHVIHKAVTIKTNKQLCPTDGIEVSVHVDFSNTTLVIPLGSSNLIPGSRYIVCVSSSNQFGVGTYGEPQLATIMTNYSMPKNEEVYIIVLGLIGGLIFMLLVYFAINEGYKKIKLKNKNVQIRSIIPLQPMALMRNSIGNGLSTLSTTPDLVDEATTSLLNQNSDSGNDSLIMETETNVSGNVTDALIPELSGQIPLHSDNETNLEICHVMPPHSQQNTTDNVFNRPADKINPVTNTLSNTLSHNYNQRDWDIPDALAANALSDTTNGVGSPVTSSEFLSMPLRNDCEINLDDGFENSNKQHNTTGYVGGSPTISESFGSFRDEHIEETSSLNSCDEEPIGAFIEKLCLQNKTNDVLECNQKKSCVHKSDNSQGDIKRPDDVNSSNNEISEYCKAIGYVGASPTRSESICSFCDDSIEEALPINIEDEEPIEKFIKKLGLQTWTNDAIECNQKKSCVQISDNLQGDKGDIISAEDVNSSNNDITEYSKATGYVGGSPTRSESIGSFRDDNTEETTLIKSGAEELSGPFIKKLRLQNMTNADLECNQTKSCVQIGDNSQGDIISAEDANSSNNDITDYCKATTVSINTTKGINTVIQFSIDADQRTIIDENYLQNCSTNVPFTENCLPSDLNGNIISGYV